MWRQHSILKLIEMRKRAIMVHILQKIWSFHIVVLQRTAKQCTEMYNAHAELLYCSLNLLFGDILVAVSIVPTVMLSETWSSKGNCQFRFKQLMFRTWALALQIRTLWFAEHLRTAKDETNPQAVKTLSTSYIQQQSSYIGNQPQLQNYTASSLQEFAEYWKPE